MSAIAVIEREVVLQGRRNNQCWFEPSIAVRPPSEPGQRPTVLVQVTQLTGNDIGPLHYIRTHDLGQRWTPPMESQALLKIPGPDHVFEAPWLRAFYHRKTDTLMGLGSTVFVQDEGTEVNHKRESQLPGPEVSIGYALWNDEQQDFEPWHKVPRPSGCPRLGIYPLQTCEAEDGTILCPCGVEEANGAMKVTTLKLAFDGQKLSVLDLGRTVGYDQPDGVCEPSIVRYGRTYFMTIRSEYGVPNNAQDGRMYHAASADGLQWEDFEPWRWDDGSLVETEQTQQHWLMHGDTLYLVYTRRSELSNGVFRSRAPLWIAQVEPDRLRLIRETEQIVFPENGARMGNFCPVNVTPDEAWVITGEWLQQYVPGHRQGMRFWCDLNNNGVAYNRIQYVGDLLLARIRWS